MASSLLSLEREQKHKDLKIQVLDRAKVKKIRNLPRSAPKKDHTKTGYKGVRKRILFKVFPRLLFNSEKNVR